MPTGYHVVAGIPTLVGWWIYFFDLPECAPIPDLSKAEGEGEGENLIMTGYSIRGCDPGVNHAQTNKPQRIWV